MVTIFIVSQASLITFFILVQIKPPFKIIVLTRPYFTAELRCPIRNGVNTVVRPDTPQDIAVGNSHVYFCLQNHHLRNKPGSTLEEVNCVNSAGRAVLMPNGVPECEGTV